MNATELVQSYFRRTRNYRTDLNALAEARDSGDSVDSLKLIKLFWHTFQPRIADSNEGGHPLQDDLEAAFLEQLADLECRYRVPYVPDSDESPDFPALNRYIHTGAASALRHRRRDGFSDYVRQTLCEVDRLLSILEEAGYFDLGYSPLEGILSPWEAVSLYGAASLGLSEIFRIKYLDGEYEDALRVALTVLLELAIVEEASHYSPLSPTTRAELRRILAQEPGETSFPSTDAIDEEDEKRYKNELEVYETIQECWPWQSLTPQQIVDAFEGLKARGKSKNWGQVASMCQAFGIDWEYFEHRRSLRSEHVTGVDGREEPWMLYWRGAEAWAEAQLGPNELRDYLYQQERDASQKRLIRISLVRLGGTYLRRRKAAWLTPTISGSLMLEARP